MKDGKWPALLFYPNDHIRDMQLLPLAAQGLWMRMVCEMSSNELHRGFLEMPNGQPMLDTDIAELAGKGIKLVRNCLLIMERIGIFSRDDRGCIYCRRMARETKISQLRRDAARRRIGDSTRAADGRFVTSSPVSGGQKAPGKSPSGKPHGTPGTLLRNPAGDATLLRRKSVAPLESTKDEILLDDLVEQKNQQKPSLPFPYVTASETRRVITTESAAAAETVGTCSSAPKKPSPPPPNAPLEFPETTLAVREKFPGADSDLIGKIGNRCRRAIVELNGSTPELPPDKFDRLLSEAVKSVYRANQTSPGLFLRTVPAAVKTFLTQGVSKRPAVSQRTMDALRMMKAIEKSK